ncbi:HAD superfamily hydrolase, putative [Babesia bigemina]|uniref:HAD superfamily hydrolase, putative n=1 Tax=Babesia bigemina TaxID=5866 RepID=A0A061D218_BABBI|nr:HAD superfamily hydrolase, putative [Babesia bigemina]CDR94791.1 HAD superfamily hydrolase, putative [Babesia bigemina]|eukprot:XP_012766977.1 HAD superfamily hydrolase, putative [Babesia bigemina]
MNGVVALFTALVGAAALCGVNAKEKSLRRHPALTRQPNYFAVDIDGTFATPQKAAMKKNIAAFRMALNAGHTLFFCTGRSPGSARNLFGADAYRAMGYNGNPGVYLDGALTYDDQGRIIDERPLTPEFLEQVAMATKDECNKFMPVFQTADEVLTICKFSEKAQAVFKAYLSTNKIPIISVEELKKRRVYNVIVNNVNEVFNSIFSQNAEEGSEVSSVEGTYDPSSNYSLLPLPHGFTQVSDINASKADSIRALLAYYGAEPSDCGSIGDGLNDIDMLESTTPSIAVGNAVPAAIAAAHITLEETCDEAAFAKAMQKVYGIKI